MTPWNARWWSGYFHGPEILFLPKKELGISWPLFQCEPQAAQGSCPSVWQQYVSEWGWRILSCVGDLPSQPIGISQPLERSWQEVLLGRLAPNHRWPRDRLLSGCFLISLALLADGHIASPWLLSNVCFHLHVQRSLPFPKACQMQESLFLFRRGNNFLACFELEGSLLLLQRVCNTCYWLGWVCAPTCRPGSEICASTNLWFILGLSGVGKVCAAGLVPKQFINP